jgi:DNA-binding CsgD family transcriptional regulator
MSATPNVPSCFAEKLIVAASLDELDRSFRAGFGRVIDAPMYGFNLRDPAGGRLTYASAANLSDAFLARYEREAMQLDPVLAQALASGRAAYNTSMMSAAQWLASPVYRRAYRLHGVRQLVEVPLIGAGGTIGDLRFADSDGARTFAAAELRLAEELARLLACAIERVRSQARVRCERDRALAALELTGTAVVTSAPATSELVLNAAARALLAPVRGAQQRVHALIAPSTAAPRRAFARRLDVALADGTAAVLHGRSSRPAGAGGSVVTVLELRSDEPQIRPALLSALTPREREVARLVVDGLSDREIGTRLFLSHHTVSQYVKRIYRKLGVDSRVALTRLLLDGG